MKLMQILCCSINIWDDYSDDNTNQEQNTHIYIENSDIDKTTKYEILNLLFNEINKLNFTEVKFELVWYDSSTKYSHLIGTEYEYLLFKRYQINAFNLSHVRRLELLDKLRELELSFTSNETTKYHLSIYSES